MNPISLVSNFLGSAIGKIATIATLLTAIATIYGLYTTRADAYEQVLIERGRAEVLQLNAKARQAILEAEIEALKIEIKKRDEIIRDLNVTTKSDRRKIEQLKGKIAKIESDRQATRITQELMQCFVDC